MTFEIVPTIQTSDLADLTGKMEALAGFASRGHLDILDGKFAEGRTIPLEALKGLDVNFKMDLHLMVKEPEEWITRALEVLPDRLVAQVEMMYEPARFISEAAQGGMEVGLALDLETPLSVMAEEFYHQVDIVLLLAAKAGKSGQPFHPEVLEKITAVRKIVGDLVDIGVDCGLNEKTVPQALAAGANIFYVNSALWHAPDPAQKYRELTQLVNKNG